MKLMVFTSRFPYPIERGDKLRIYHQIRELSQHHEVVLVTLHDHAIPEKDMTEMKQYCQRIYPFRLTKFSIIWHLALSLLNQRPAQLAYFFRPKWKRKIREIIEKEQPDHLYCQLLRIAAYVRDVPMPKTLDFMDALSVGMKRRADQSPWWLRPIFRREAKLLARYERALLADFDHFTIISTQDRDHIHPGKSSDIQVISNGVDTSFFVPQTVPTTVDLVFVGNLGYFPNVEAAKYLAQKVMPLLGKEVHLSLAGARPTSEVMALASDRVSVSGWVDDIRDAYASAKVMVAPLFAGSGQQNKILEAMAMGVPCVTTPLVNRAIGALEGDAILLAESPEDFARHINRLLTDDAEATRIGQAGLQFVQKMYSWEGTVKELMGVWK